MSTIDSKGIHRADTTKGPPLRILSLDGGGVRGYSMFILLEELMHQTYVEMTGRAPRRHEIPKPCDHFDLIIGTGTGGLIAIMLGRLRLDLATCKDVYVRMTRRVFETDKTFAGIPYRSTLFKASKMEEAIRECVAEHTVSDEEGNDSLATAQDLRSPVVPGTPTSGMSEFSGPGRHQRSMSQTSRFSDFRSNSIRPLSTTGAFGNPNAKLYDVRENRTKTAVTAVYRGSRSRDPPAFLRSYDSRKEPPPEFDATIWQAGRATTAIGLAFKPIQIGQSIYCDEGSGRFNPTPEALDEATVNEWPGREIGVLVSIGTGKRPSGPRDDSRQWYESFLGGALGDFAEARRRLFEKIEGCEETHLHMVREGLSKRQVNNDCYFRLNVEVGVGEFGMNEWNRLTDISTNTKMYLSRPEVQQINQGASNRLARIHKAKLRWDRAMSGNPGIERNSWEEPMDPNSPGLAPPTNPLAVEMPGDTQYTGSSSSNLTNQTSRHDFYNTNNANPNPTQPHHASISSDDKILVSHPSPQSTPGSTVRSDEFPQVVTSQQQQSSYPQYPTRPLHRPQQRQTSDGEKMVVPSPPTSSHSSNLAHQQQQQPPLPPRNSSDTYSHSSHPPSLPPRTSMDHQYQQQHQNYPSIPPPIPPKTPVGFEGRTHGAPPSLPASINTAGGNHITSPTGGGRMNSPNGRLPYPSDDGPPPVVNMSKKPQWS